MTCERCGDREGAIRYTEYAGGVPKKLLICAECAKELGFGDVAVPGGTASPTPAAPATPPPFPAGASVFAAEEFLVGPEVETAVCPQCGLRGSDLRNVAVLGCAECYETFSGVLAPVLHRLHGDDRHRGRVPGSEQDARKPEDTE